VTCREPPDTHPRVTDVDANVADPEAGQQPVADRLPPVGGAGVGVRPGFIRMG